MFYKILIIGIISDLASKYIASIYLGETINILGNLLYLKYVENTGIAFSMYVPSLLLKIITISLIIGIFYYYINEKKEIKNKLFNISFALILAGAIGNGIERVFFGRVIDFIGVNYFAIFNLADSFISIGAGLYIIYLYKNKEL